MVRRFIDTDGVIPEEWTLTDTEATVRQFMDVEPVIERVARQRAETGGRCALGYNVGSVPYPVAMHYARTRGIEVSDLLFNPAYGSELVALCQAREYRKFSPSEGKA